MNNLNLFTQNKRAAPEQIAERVPFVESGFETKLDWIKAGMKKNLTPKTAKIPATVEKKVIPSPEKKVVEAVAPLPVITTEKKVLPDLRSRKDIVVQDDEEETEALISESEDDDENDDEISETDQQHIETLKGETESAIESLAENLEKINIEKSISEEQKTEILQSFALLVGAMSTTNDYVQTYSKEQIIYFNTMFIYVENSLKNDGKYDDVMEALDETISEFNGIK
jgi:hypothetical protein